MASEPLIFQFDDVRVDTRNAQIFKAGKPASVEPKAFQVLVYLLHDGNEIGFQSGGLRDLGARRKSNRLRIRETTANIWMLGLK